MVSDFRSILFSAVEVTAAFSAFRYHVPDVLPPGDIIDLAPHPDGLAITVADRTGPTAETKVRVVTAAIVLRVLLTKCIECGIMIPRAGRKHVALEPKQVRLNIELDIGPECPDFIDPLLLHHLDPVPRR